MTYNVITTSTCDDYKRPDVYTGTSRYDTKEDAYKAACLAYLEEINMMERWDELSESEVSALLDGNWVDFLNSMENSDLFVGEYVPRTLTVSVSGGGSKELSSDQKERLTTYLKKCGELSGNG
jgi:hypothetical protein